MPGDKRYDKYCIGAKDIMRGAEVRTENGGRRRANGTGRGNAGMDMRLRVDGQRS